MELEKGFFNESNSPPFSKKGLSETKLFQILDCFNFTCNTNSNNVKIKMMDKIKQLF